MSWGAYGGRIMGQPDSINGNGASGLSPSKCRRGGAGSTSCVGWPDTRCEATTPPQLVRGLLRVKLRALEHEVFTIIHLDAQNRIIDYVGMSLTLPHGPRLRHAQFRQ